MGGQTKPKYLRDPRTGVPLAPGAIRLPQRTSKGVLLPRRVPGGPPITFAADEVKFPTSESETRDFVKAAMAEMMQGNAAPKRRPNLLKAAAAKAPAKKGPAKKRGICPPAVSQQHIGVVWSKADNTKVPKRTVRNILTREMAQLQAVRDFKDLPKDQQTRATLTRIQKQTRVEARQHIQDRTAVEKARRVAQASAAQRANWDRTANIMRIASEQYNSMKRAQGGVMPKGAWKQYVKDAFKEEEGR